MLIKIDNKTKELEAAIDLIKKETGEVTASKAALNAILQYGSLQNEIDDLNGRLGAMSGTAMRYKYDLEQISNAFDIVNRFKS